LKQRRQIILSYFDPFIYAAQAVSMRKMIVNQQLDDGGSDDSSSHEGSVIESSKSTSDNDKFVIAQAETKALLWGKMVVMTVLLLSALGVAMAVYRYTSNSETSVFEEQFENDAVKIFEAIGNTLDMSLGSIDSFLVSVSSLVTYANITWPFVNIVSMTVDVGTPCFSLETSSLKHVNHSPTITSEHQSYEGYRNRSFVHSIISLALTKGKSGKISHTKTMVGYQKV